MTTMDRLKRIGSQELKKRLGPNLVRGLIVSVFIHSAVVSMGLIEWGEKVIKETKGDGVITVGEFIMPQPEEDQYVKPIRPRKPTLSEVKIPIPMETEIEESDTVLEAEELNKDDLFANVFGLDPDSSDYENEGRSGGLGDPDNMEKALAGLVKNPWEEFVACEIRPVPLSTNPQPEFPSIAARAGIAAKVFVWVHVGTDGTVKEWKIIHVTTPNLGFEEAVEAIIEKWQFTPAVQSSHPIAVWVNIPFNFKVKQ